MGKMPSTPPEWDDQATDAPQQTLPSGSDNASGGLLSGLQSPDWNLENSGLGFLLHPQTIAQIDFGDGQDFDASPPHIEPVAAKTSGHREPTMAFTVPAFEMPTVKLDHLGPLPQLLPPRVPYSPSPFEKGMDALGRGPLGKAWDQFSDSVRGTLRSEWGDRILTAVEKSSNQFIDGADWLEKPSMGSGTYGIATGKRKYIKGGDRGMETSAYLKGIGIGLGAPAALARAIQQNDKAPIYRWLNEAAKPSPENPFKKRRR